MKNSGKIMLVFSVLLMLISSAVYSEGRADPGTLEKTVQYLLDVVTCSNLVFIRNGEQHNGEEAAAHMRKKYNYFKNRIETPENFIEYAATKSLMSGKPYLVVTESGEKMLCARWLRQVLSAYRQNKHAYSVDCRHER